jgi:hypothetical protein
MYVGAYGIRRIVQQNFGRDYEQKLYISLSQTWGWGRWTDFVRLRRMIRALTSLRMGPFELCSRRGSRIEGYAGTLP